MISGSDLRNVNLKFERKLNTPYYSEMFLFLIVFIYTNVVVIVDDGTENRI